MGNKEKVVQNLSKQCKALMADNIISGYNINSDGEKVIVHVQVVTAPDYINIGITHG